MSYRTPRVTVCEPEEAPDDLGRFGRPFLSSPAIFAGRDSGDSYAIRNSMDRFVGARGDAARPPIEAIRFAIEMLGKGFDSVVIVDLAQGGKAYTPSEFAKFYKETKK